MADRLARLTAAGLDENTAAPLARLPAAQVDLIVKALRAAQRKAIADDKAKRRQRRQDRREHHHIEDTQYADATLRVVQGMARRAGMNLDMLTGLASLHSQLGNMLHDAVADARKAGYTDAEIGAALGYPPASSKQAVGRRFGRRRSA